MIQDKKALDNHKQYLERKKVYKKYGLDIDNEIRVILNKAEPIWGEILEIGTGKGYFALSLAREGHRFTTVDISEDEQRFAKLNFKYFGLEKKTQFISENAEKMNFTNNSFDIIFSINAIHHFKRPFKVMRELDRILKAEGKIVLSDFSEEGLEVLDKIHARDGRKHQVSEFTVEDMEAYFKKKKFETRNHITRFQKVVIIHKTGA